MGDRTLAEDLLQDTLLAAYRSRGDLIDVDNAVAWLYAIARNRALAADRRRQLAARAQLLQEIRDHPDPAEAAAVRDLLERYLERDELALLILRYLHGFDSRELGEIFDTSAEAIRQRLSRIRRRLAGVLTTPTPATEAPDRRRPLLQQFTSNARDEDESLVGLVRPLAAVEGPGAEPRDLLRRRQWGLDAVWSRLRSRR